MKIFKKITSIEVVIVLFYLLVFAVSASAMADPRVNGQAAIRNCFDSAHILYRYGKFKAMPLQYETTFSRVGGYQIEGDGPSVIALHGFSGDANYLLEFGRQLNQKGGFNFIGLNAVEHGKKRLKTVHKSGLPKGYASLPNAIRDIRDFYEVILAEYKRTGQKVIIAGHSRGGMLKDMLALAIDYDFVNKTYFINQHKWEKLNEIVDAGVLLSAPAPRKDSVRGILDTGIAHAFAGVMNKVGKINIPGVQSLSPFSNEGNSLTDKALELVLEQVAKVGKRKITDTSIINTRLSTDREVFGWLAFGTSGTHGGHMIELRKMVSVEKGFHFMGIDLTHPALLPAFDIVRVIGDLDRILKTAGTSSHLEDNVIRAAQFDQSLIAVEGASHLDILDEAGVNSYIKHLIYWLEYKEFRFDSRNLRVSVRSDEIQEIRRDLLAIRKLQTDLVSYKPMESLLEYEKKRILGGSPVNEFEQAAEKLLRDYQYLELRSELKNKSGKYISGMVKRILEPKRSNWPTSFGMRLNSKIDELKSGRLSIQELYAYINNSKLDETQKAFLMSVVQVLNYSLTH
jgi:pimeloyl-ACP methyl ester carboxylesterase